jgi:prepilin-type N-terminal cleavage/methylation domain-containing protein
MIRNNIKKLEKDRGFTIVELLVVIVVIAILAAITIVSYAGITSRANTSSAQAAANSVYQKALAYQTDSTAAVYPLTLADMTGDSTKTYYLSGVTYGALGSVPATPNVIRYTTCGSGTPTQHSEIDATNITGFKVGYWDYSTSSVNETTTSGTISGGTVACFATGS